tara:strand:- start:749 stop:1012 length:264 start_codon:yes stop_codon:yes gene_type:complete
MTMNMNDAKVMNDVDHAAAERDFSKYETARYMIIEGFHSTEAGDEGLANEARAWGERTFQGHPTEDDLLEYIDSKECHDMSDVPVPF